MSGFHLDIADRKKDDKHRLSWFPKAPSYDHPSASLITLWEIVMVGPILCAGTSAMHRLYVIISFIICSCFVTLQVCNRGYDLLWCACRQSNWWLKEHQWREKHYTRWHWRSLGSNLKRMIIQISSCHLHWRDFAIALLTSWVGMRVIINLRISPLLPEVSKRTIVGTNWRKYFFPQRSWERAKWTAQGLLQAWYWGPGARLFLPRGSREPWTTYTWRYFILADFLSEISYMYRHLCPPCWLLFRWETLCILWVHHQLDFL